MMDEIALFRWLNDLAGQSEVFDGFVRFMIGDHLIPFLAVLTVAWLWFAGRGAGETRRYQEAALRGLVALGICQLGVALINIAVGRPRPFVQLPDVTVLFYEPINSSFPAHPVATVVALAAVWWTVRRLPGAVLFVLGIALGVGRIIAGVWFPTDVLGGIAVGLLSAWAGTWALGRLTRAVRSIRRIAARLGVG